MVPAEVARLSLTTGNASLPDERLTELTLALRGFLRELGAASVRPAEPGMPLAGEKGLPEVDPYVTVVVAAIPILRQAIRVVERWLTQAPPKTTVRIEWSYGKRRAIQLNLPDATPEERARLLELLGGPRKDEDRSDERPGQG